MKKHQSQFSNSCTNFLHASALGLYTYWVYESPEGYNRLILSTFLLLFIAKILGVIAHLPQIETRRYRHVTLWTSITVVTLALNIVILCSLKLTWIVLLIGILFACSFSAMYLWSLSKTEGNYTFLVFGYLTILIICISTTVGLLRIAWICLLLSNVAWILLEKISYLKERQLHNDIYHLLLIGSTYLLYYSVTLGLWG